MKKLLLLTLLFVQLAYLQANNDSYTKYVNPMVGTDFTGHTFPGAAYPFGMVQLSPDTGLTGWEVCSGYHYEHREIFGFSHTHLSGTGCEDYCDILLMPVVGYTGEIDNKIYRSPFSHENEYASPGYYSVLLDKWSVKAELTAGKRVGMHKYSYPKGERPQIIIDLTHRDYMLDGELRVVDKNTITGFRRSHQWARDQMLHFYLQFSEPIEEYRLERSKTDEGEKDTKLIVTFKKRSNNTILAKIGLSSVSSENAKMNLESEVKGWEFDALRKSTNRAWNDYLSKIEVTTDNLEDKKVFYTAMYHTAIAPNIYSDVNGEYRGMDKKIHKSEGYDQYTVFSLWDTYRALHPLFAIIERERSVEFLKSFQTIFEQAGKLPIWELSRNETDCMIGYHSISVIADSYAKGIRDFDCEKLLEAMIESSNKNEYGIDVYRKSGLVQGEHEHESVSKTLEYAYDDWCIAIFAKQLGHNDIYNKYIERAQYYKNIFDPTTGFMRPKIWGRWMTPFNPTDVNNHFTEANSWQYSFYVPQDIETHIEMLGGDTKYNKVLDELFNTSEATTGRNQADITGLIGQYAHGNEPSHHAAYLYAYSGEQWKSQEVIYKILKTLYTSQPDGLCGNDDCGQMSAWYVLSALGFYPVAPGSDVYVIGAPLFEKSVINLENGKKFTIEANRGNNSDKMLYINSLKIDNKTSIKSWFPHSVIENGCTLTFDMSPEPNYSFGKEPNNRPKSRIIDNIIVTNPYVEVENTIFKESAKVEIKSASEDYDIFYKIVEGETIRDEDINYHSQYRRYEDPLTITASSIIYSFCSDKTGKKSHVTTTKLNQINVDMSIELLSRYSRTYNAGGDEGLIDGVRGSSNFRLGGWQGYQGTDFEAIIDLGSVKEVKSVMTGFHHDARSWIWMPVYVEYYISEDGVNYQHLGRVEHDVDERDYTPQSHELGIKEINKAARYIKVFAKSYGTIPEWHPGAGGQGFIFIDEIVVEK